MANTVSFSIHFERNRDRRKQLVKGPTRPRPPVSPRVQRVTKLMALAIRIDDLIRLGEIRDYAEAAKLGHVTRARMTQIMGMLNLAPDIQVMLLELPSVDRGRDRLTERHLRPVQTIRSWREQRISLQRLLADTISAPGVPATEERAMSHSTFERGSRR